VSIMRLTSRRARATVVLAAVVALTPLAAARAGDPGTTRAPAAAQPVPVDNPRPSGCAPLPSAQGGAGTEPQTATGTFPWPATPKGTNPEDYAAYLHTPAVTPPVRPANWSNGGGAWKLTSARDTDPTLAGNPQQLCGVEGNSVDTAWQVTTGRPDTVIAITDSGIEWCDTAVVDKVYLNRQALPLPEDASGRTKPQLEAAGVRFADGDPYDLDNRGVFNVEQYANDPRIARPLFCKTFISPEDLIRAFGHGGRAGPAGYTEAIAGWNFVDDNNDPYDDVHYDHGSGEAEDSTGAADALGKEIGACPNCMVLPVRVGQSFIAEGNAFARGVAFAVDSGASVIQEALGTLDETTTDAQAISYANAHGVPVIASAADEEAEHHNEPGNLPGTIVVNSVTQSLSEAGVPLQAPRTYLAVNGCTNYGANVAVAVESASCSSEATGKAGGITGLIESEARSLLGGGRLAAYPGLSSVAGRPVALSPTEVRELITMAADDVDFETAAPPFGPPDNYAVVSPVPTTRYPTQPGYDMYTGYGRIDAGRILGWLAAGKVPPEASFGAMDWFQTYDPLASSVVVDGMAAAVRTPGRSFRWELQYGIGTQPEPGAWHDLSGGAGVGSVPVHVTLGPSVLGRIAAGLPPALGASGSDAYAFTLRLVTIDAHGLVGMDRRTEYLHHDPTLVASVHPGGSIDGAPTLAPIGPGGNNALVVATSDGVVHAFGPGMRELPGWPVSTVALASHSGAVAYASGAVGVPHGTIVGGVAVGDLLGTGSMDVVAADMTGRVYAWTAAGRLLPGFPVMTRAAFSEAAARDQHNRLLPGILGAPVLAPLDGGRQLDIVASSMDRHVYAWRPSGAPVPGWPVLVVDRSEVAAIDPVTNKVTFKPGSGVGQGTKLVDAPAIGRLDGGSGPPDVVVDTNEEYSGAPNVSAEDAVNWAVGQVPLLNPANSRIYAFAANGSLLRGWPAAIGDFDAELLPDVGDGTTASPALADLAGNGQLETGIITTVGPGYILKPDGTSYLGTGPDGKPLVLAAVGASPLSNSPEYPTLPAVGAPIFAPLGTGAPGISFIAPAASAGKALDAAIPDRQFPNDNQVDAWNTSSGALQPAFPQFMNDLQFLVEPIVADVGGAGPYVVEGSATSDIRAVNGLGQSAPGFPKFTGDWMVQAPSFGPLGTLADQVLVAGTRQGDVLVWTTPTPRCAASGPWPRDHHDLSNTSNLDAGGAAAYRCAG